MLMWEKLQMSRYAPDVDVSQNYDAAQVIAAQAHEHVVSASSQYWVVRPLKARSSGVPARAAASRPGR